MSEKHLHNTDIGPLLQEPRRETVAVMPSSA
jgi:hypothetical protein